MKSAIVTFDVERAYKTRSNVSEVTSFLDEVGIKGTLFVTGDLLDEEIDDLRVAQKHGHEIGSHGYDHPYFYNEGWVQETESLLQEAHLADYVRRSYEVFRDMGLEVNGLRTIGFRTNPLLLSEVSKYFDYYAGQGRRVRIIADNLLEIPISKVFLSYSFHPALLLYIPTHFLADCVAKAPEPVVLYFHSFDLMIISHVLTFHTAWWKRVLYYNRTGPILKQKMRELIHILQSKGYEFISCGEFYRKFFRRSSLS